jgi:hypothetical protein
MSKYLKLNLLHSYLSRILFFSVSTLLVAACGGGGGVGTVADGATSLASTAPTIPVVPQRNFVTVNGSVDVAAVNRSIDNFNLGR